MNTAFFWCLLSVVSLIGATQSQKNGTHPPAVVRRTEVRDNSGQYILSYLTSDGTIVNEQGKLKKVDNEQDEVLVKEGSFNYISPEGQTISLKYVADELGFRPEGAHLPVPVQPIQPVYTEN